MTTYFLATTSTTKSSSSSTTLFSLMSMIVLSVTIIILLLTSTITTTTTAFLLVRRPTTTTTVLVLHSQQHKRLLLQQKQQQQQQQYQTQKKQQCSSSSSRLYYYNYRQQQEQQHKQQQHRTRKEQLLSLSTKQQQYYDYYPLLFMSTVIDDGSSTTTFTTSSTTDTGTTTTIENINNNKKVQNEEQTKTVVRKDEQESTSDNPTSTSSSSNKSSLSSIRKTLRKITGFSLTSLRTTLRLATGISLSQTIKKCIGLFPIWIRFIFQPMLILYYWPLFLLRNIFGLSSTSKKEAREVHTTFITSYLKSIEEAQETLFLGEFTEFVDTTSENDKVLSLATDMILEAEQITIEEEDTTSYDKEENVVVSVKDIPITEQNDETTSKIEQKQYNDNIDEHQSLSLTTATTTTTTSTSTSTNDDEINQTAREHNNVVTKSTSVIPSTPTTTITQDEVASTITAIKDTVVPVPATTTTTTTTTKATLADDRGLVVKEKEDITTTRSEYAASDINFSGVWKLIDNEEFKNEYDLYLKGLGQPSLVRGIALSLIGFTREEIIQSQQGKMLQINGINPRGIWNRQLISSNDKERIYKEITTADGEPVEVEAWWENYGQIHVSWLRGGKKYGGGDFESKRYLLEDNILVCESIFHPNDPNMKKISSSKNTNNTSDMEIST